MRLTAKQAEHAKPGKHSDGDGLTLVVQQSGARSWVVRYRDASNKRRDKGIGGYPAVSLSEARRMAAVLHADASTGEPTPAPEPAVMTFAEAAVEVVDKLKGTKWKRNPEANAKVMHSRLRNYAAPLLDKPVTHITPVDVHDVVMACDKPETARLLRSNIRRVIGGVMFRYGMTANPAGEAIDDAVIRKPHVPQHRRSIHHSEVGEALDIVDRSGRGDSVRLCLRLLTLTALRSREVREACWSEIDFDAETWTVPAERMKTGIEHRVPLSRQAVEVLIEAKKSAGESPYCFPGYRGRPVSAEALRNALEANAIDCTPHGMRSSFRTWALEHGHNRDTSEAALAHTLGDNPVEAAYIRSDLFDQRKQLMQRWADFLAMR